jgi:protein SCO1/2
VRRLAALLIVVALVLAGCGGDDAQLAGSVRTPLPEMGGLALPDASRDGASFAMRASDGGLLVVYFGYTSCPDVCPTTLADLRKAFRELGDDAAQVEVAMATVDPGRDTDEVITNYVQSFIPRAHGLRTENDALLSSVADAFGAVYSVTTAANGDVEVVHSAQVYVIDDQGRLRVTWPFGMTAADMARDLELLLRSA